MSFKEKSHKRFPVKFSKNQIKIIIEKSRALNSMTGIEG